ncbi:4-hydroxy-3-methylbut-2-enyl diphosphate reductase [Lachnospiraceae bacterium G11]|nr:4-hydroxy-3-methylbut-2-enyl diphosphate reductase [Lachnospiraceae bacterium G11]
MEVKLAKSLGYCFGVERAVEKAYSLIDQGKKIYTYGPIIHNETVVSDLEKKGVEIIESIDDIAKLNEGSVVIRAHGVSKAVYDALEEKGLEIIDATCPFVKRIHNTVSKESKNGADIVIVGNAGHPEVLGIVGWCESGATVIESEEEAESYTNESGRKICIVSQTTFQAEKFQHIVEIIQKKGYNVIVVNTICNATEDRQLAAEELATEADAMIVIGGMNSSNTKKLFEICRKRCVHTYFIQTLDDLHLELPKSVRLVGITAGASTPNKIIEEVQNYVRINF